MFSHRFNVRSKGAVWDLVYQGSLNSSTIKKVWDHKRTT